MDVINVTMSRGPFVADDPQHNKGLLFPSHENILQTEVATAARVATSMFDHGLATAGRPQVRTCVEAMFYKPQYEQEA